MDPACQTLFLWRNDKTVVIGRHQNAWKECHVKKMEEDGVFLARRQSGGGAVYQDLGNTCFTFLSPQDGYSKENNNKIITSALLQQFGIEAVASGRNDIVIKESGRKISGSAFKQTADRSFHHGTLLINLNMTALQNYLNPNKKKLESKGVSSIAARVVNLQELNPQISHETLSEAIVQQFFKHYNADCQVENLDVETLKSTPSLNSYFNLMADWDWRFGKSPDFSYNFETRFDWGIMDIHINVADGKIRDAKVFSDTLFPQLVDEVEKHLKNTLFTKQGIEEAMGKVKAHFVAQQQPDIAKCVTELTPWIVSCI